jgi:hypothetical protein
VGGASLTHGYLMAAFQAARIDAVYLITLNRAFGPLVYATSEIIKGQPQSGRFIN